MSVVLLTNGVNVAFQLVWWHMMVFLALLVPISVITAE